MDEKDLAKKEFIEDQEKLWEQYEKRQGGQGKKITIDMMTKMIDEKNDFVFPENQKAIEYINANPDIKERAAKNDGTISYDDAERIALNIYKKGEYEASDNHNTIYGVFAEKELSKELVSKIMNFDPEIEDRLVINGEKSTPDTEKYDYFLMYMGYDIVRKSNVFTFNWVKKGLSMEKYYTEMPELTDKYDFPTYKTKEYHKARF